ncbi:MAG: hypothetical protein JWQ72_1866 [Polaromonas sp.]|nr:hypothetical protein [Polaromonas sp.]
MNEEQALAYVRAVAAAVALPLDDAAAQRVAVHLGRTAVLAAQLEAFPLDVSDEPAEIYCPALFPDPRSTPGAP